MAVVEGVASIIKTDVAGVVSSIVPLTQTTSSNPAIFVQTKFFDLSPWFGPNIPRDSMVRLRGILLEMEQADPVFLRVLVGSKENINDPEVWTSEADITPGQVFHLNLTARFLAIKILDTIPTIPWQLSAIVLFGTPVGRARR